MQKHHVSLSSYQFRRAPHGGLIQVLNEGLYVMAVYCEQTGAVKWQRVVLASQREQIERRLSEQYPVRANAMLEAKRRVSPRSDRAAAQIQLTYAARFAAGGVDWRNSLSVSH